MFQRALSGSGGGSAVAQKIVFSGTAGGNMTPVSNAFDGNPSTKSVSAQNVSSGYLTFKFNSPVKANIFGFKGNTDRPNLNPHGINVSVSTDNGNTWSIIARGGGGADPSTNMSYCCCENDTAYDFYRFDMASRANGGYTYSQVSEIEMYYLEGLKFGN